MTDEVFDMEPRVPRKCDGCGRRRLTARVRVPATETRDAAILRLCNGCIVQRSLDRAEHDGNRAVALRAASASIRVEQSPYVKHDAPHPSGGDRYAIYSVQGVQQVSGDDTARRRLAETSMDGIGITLCTLRHEGDITNDTRVGVLDRETRTWIVNPWAKGDNA